MHDHRYEGDDSTSRVEKNEMWSTSDATHQRSFDHFVQCSTGNVLIDAVSHCLNILNILIKITIHVGTKSFYVMYAYFRYYIYIFSDNSNMVFRVY